MGKKYEVLWSETWMSGIDYLQAQKILDETLETLESERVINIEVIKELNGLYRYWVYVESPRTPTKSAKRPKPLQKKVIK